MLISCRLKGNPIFGHNLMKNYPIKIIKVSNPMFSGSRKPKKLFSAIIDIALWVICKLYPGIAAFQNDKYGFRQKIIQSKCLTTFSGSKKPF